jgi:hypothetical protein
MNMIACTSCIESCFCSYAFDWAVDRANQTFDPSKGTNHFVRQRTWERRQVWCGCQASADQADETRYRAGLGLWCNTIQVEHAIAITAAQKEALFRGRCADMAEAAFLLTSGEVSMARCAPSRS